MAGVAVVLVLLTATANATALVLQRKATQDAAREQEVATVGLRDVARRRTWLLGLAVFVVAVALQVGALSLGSIALVQPVLVMELPFTLLLGWAVLGGALGPAEWTAVAAMSAGLIVLLLSLRPGGGDALATPAIVWGLGSAVTLAGLVLLVAAGSRAGRASRAALYGLAAGAGSGFVAVIVKAMSGALVRGGLGEVLTTWQSYLLVPAAPLAFLALQAALRAGRLVASQPGFVLGNPVLSATWGVALLGERVAGGVAVIGAVAGAVLIAGGVIGLSRSPLLAAQEGVQPPG